MAAVAAVAAWRALAVNIEAPFALLLPPLLLAKAYNRKISSEQKLPIVVNSKIFFTRGSIAESCRRERARARSTPIGKRRAHGVFAIGRGRRRFVYAD